MARAKKIITGLFSDKETDQYKYKFNKKATPDEIKAHIKANFKEIKKDLIPDEYRGYYGKVAGGKKRAKQAVRIDGKYISDVYIEDNNLQVLAEKRGFKNVQELFKKDPDFYKAAKDIYYSESGAPIKYHSDEAIYKLDTFGGKIIINGKEYTKIKAIEYLNEIDKTLKRKHDVFLVEYWFNYKKGGAEIEINTPSLNRVKKSDYEELLEFLESADQENLIEITDSPGANKAKEKTQKELIKEKTKKGYNRFTYNYTVIYNGKHKSGTVQGYNKIDAQKAVNAKYKGNSTTFLENQSFPKKFGKGKSKNKKK